MKIKCEARPDKRPIAHLHVLVLCLQASPPENQQMVERYLGGKVKDQQLKHEGML